MEKQELRAALRRQMETLEEEYRRQASLRLAAHLFKSELWQKADTVFCFAGRGRELDTRPILEEALARGKRLCLPLCTGPGIMEARQITRLDQLHPGAWQIPEPDPTRCPLVKKEEMDLILTPCLAAGLDGSRMGQGGGFYDRYLEQRDSRALLLCYQKMVRPGGLNTDPWDVTFDRLLTEEGIFRCP